MFIIANDDISKVRAAVAEVVSGLLNGASKYEKDVELGDDFKPMKVIGYWVMDVMRIDIKIKK